MSIRWSWGFRTIAYSLEITVNYVAGVEVVHAFGDIKELAGEVSVEQNITEGHLQDRVGLRLGVS